MEEHYYTFSSHLASHLPALADHFTRLALRPDLYLLDWLMTLYSRALPLDVTCRIWDLIARDGETFLIKAALGILALYEERLLAETDFVLIAQFLSRLPDDINSDLLFEKIEVCRLALLSPTQGENISLKLVLSGSFVNDKQENVSQLEFVVMSVLHCSTL